MRNHKCIAVNYIIASNNVSKRAAVVYSPNTVRLVKLCSVTLCSGIDRVRYLKNVNYATATNITDSQVKHLPVRFKKHK